MIKKILIISITLFTIVSSELCVYDKRGTRRYFNKELTDINEIFISLKRKGYITDPYNTYFGNCYSNNGLINIYGVKVNKVEPLENFTKFKREETLKELFDLKEGNRRCNLLTSESAEGNPYSEELTGIKNSNVREGWKLVQVSTKAVDSKNSLSETFSVSFDKSYSISVQKSYSNTEGVTIENHVDHTDSNSFSDSISKVVEETLSKSNSNESGETWDSSFAKDITKTNEQHSETNWNNERNSSDTSGTNSSQENGTNWNNSSTSGSSTTTTTDETKADSVGGGGSIGAFGIGVNGSYTHETSTSKGTSSEVNSSTTNDRGGSSSTTSGTSTDRTVGQSDSTGGSKGLSDSISTSESLTNSNGGSRTVSNSVERSSTTGETEESSKTREIGMTTGNSETSEHSVTYGEDTSVQFSNSTSASFSVEESISGLGTGHPCEIAIYKKIKRHIQITSCYDRDENKNYERNTRSIINIDVDFNAINRYREILNQTDIDPMNLKGDGQILTACVLDSDNSQFKREYNFFEQAKELINGSVKTYNPVMIPGMVLTPNKEQITDRDPTEKNSQFYMRKLTNEGGSMVYYYGNNKLYDTETSNISNNCKFRISSKNHLEMFLDDETLFLPVGSYAEEFESEKSRYKEDPNAPFFNDTIMEIPEPILKPNTTDIPKKGNTNKYIDHLNKDELTYSLFINRGQEECKLIFEFCNSHDEKADEFENYLEETNEDLLDYIYIENICGSKEQFNYSYSEEEIEYICSKNKDELDVINKNNEEIHAKCDCEKYTKCINMQTDNSSFDSFLFTSDCNLLNKEFNCSTQCRTLIARANTPYIADVSNFKIKDVVVWSSVRPEHQNLIVGWNGNNIGYETSYLTLKKYNNYNSDDYEGLTLYDPTGAPIWEFRAEGTSSSDKLDKEGYYLPVKYGYPFNKDCLNEMSETSNNSEVTENTISKKKEDDNINVRSTIAKRNKRNIHRNKNKRSEVKIQKRDEDEDEEVIEDENGMEDEDVIDDEGGMEDEDVIDDEGGMEDEDVIDDDDGMQYEDVIDDDDGMQYEDVIDDDDDENDGKNDNRNNNRNDNGNDTKKDNQNENNNGKNDSKCNNVINEFSCMTLRSKGVYLYGDSEPFYNYTINTESKLRLDKETGLLTIDGIQIIHLDYPAATPTKIRCEMIDDMYGVALYDRFGVKIWEYPSKIRYYMNNKYPHDTMVVDRSIYYYNNNTRKNEACLDFKKDGLYNGETKITLDIDKETAGRSLYLNKTHIYMQDIHDKIISKSIIKLYNPENHDVKLYCKDKDTIVVADEITNNIVWSYPKKQYTLLSSNTEYNELRPDQQLIYPEESVNNFCLEVKGNNITSIDYPNMLSYDKPNIIEYLGVTNKGVFVHFGNNRKIDLLNNYYGELKNELDNLNEAENANDFNKSQENKEGIYSIKCEKLFGKVKASVYYNDTFLTTLPPYDKKYIINSTSLLYYGEKLYNEDTKEECLIFDDNKLYTRYLNKTIFDSKNTLKRELLNSEYIKIEEKSLLLNNDVALATVQNISGKKKIYGKCMFYHGGNKFVLYSDDYEKVMMEFPSISNKDILQDDDIIYDDLYVDLNASPQEKCIRIGTVNEDKENQSVNAKDEKIGLFFYKETVPFTNITVPSIPYNNTLRFNQENGVLLLNEVDILSKQFTKDLSLKCEKEYGTLYAIIRNSENEEQWRYPSFNKKSSISYKNDEKLETGEYLYDDHNNECFKLSEYGIIIDGELKYKACDNRNVKTCSYTRYLYIDKTKGTDVYMVNFFEDHNKIETILEIKTKSKNINLRCDKSLGLYIIDDDKNILYKSKTQIFNNTNLFTNKNNSVLQVGDQIQTDDKTNCAYIDNELNLVVGDKKFPNANEIKISNKYPPVTIGSTILFEEITNKTLPEHMSLRCKREETETLLVLYDDDNDFIIDEIMNKCRKHKLYVTNEHHNNYICIDDPLKNSYEDMCLLYNKDHKIIDSNQRILFSGYKNRNLISNNLYLDTATGNLIAKDRTEDITLLAINRKNVKMECGKYDEVLITDRNKNDELIWMHRPYLNCENGLELESSDCKSIYKYEKVGNFEINEKSFGKYYKDDIIKLSLNEDGELIANDNKIIIKDEWNVKNKYNYILNCDEDYNCKFINTYNDEIIDYLDKNHVAKSTINPTEKIGMGEKLLCKNVSLVLTNKGLIYRNHKKKVETDFMGELNDIATSDSAVISYAGFDSDYNFKLYYKDQYQPLNLISFKDISGNPSKNKYIRVSCEEDKLEFYEMYKNKKYVYYSFSYPPEPTKTTKKTPTPTPKQSYSEYTFKGVIGNEYYLGVPSLSNISKIEILSSKHNPYFTWIFDSTSSPSFMYLANSKNGKLGKKSNYCLDINDPYISIVNCANAKHKFKYGGGEYSSVLYVYSKNSNGSYVNTNKCIRYTDRPKFESCEDPSDGKYPGFRWVKNSVGTYKEN
ncbi:hypothetical protein LY90DRAFT_519832 [Neocallimastix californiae]|uniref:Uncharacterized protein n=1 Tax=Neocallimastix californiae TaxID=1754190 RepID=A0A1Y1YQC9_9FUNG|nr:hypothetical protein LY90DRAFT_519832 [Neocallimastix californiae]|eukprot:ORY00189.1 hypothetical protein LY90DRAFT_519832 [Neocallimastix californiae]